ncbi:MAG: hypothetical protein WAQ25_00085 [Candidatus Saccharimonas sp.]
MPFKDSFRDPTPLQTLDSDSYDPESFVSAADTAQAFYDAMQKRKLEPTVRHAHYNYGTLFNPADFNKIIWPTELQSAFDTMGTNPVDVQVGISRTPEHTEIAFEITLSNDSSVHIRGHMNNNGEPTYEFFYNQKKFTMPHTMLGVTLATMALRGEHNDEAHLSPGYYNKPLQPIDPFNPTLLGLIEASLTDTCRYDTDTTYRVQYNNPIEDRDVEIEYRIQRGDDGAKTYTLTCQETSTDPTASTTARYGIHYKIDGDMHLLEPAPFGEVIVSPWANEPSTSTAIDNQVAIDFTSTVLERATNQLVNGTGATVTT